jgi:hypothetical protein
MGLATHRAELLPRTAHPGDIRTTTSVNQIFQPWDFATQADSQEGPVWSLAPALPANAALPGQSILHLAHQDYGN